MKRSIEILKFVVLLGLLIFLFSFSNKRNEKRKLSKVEVEFVDTKTPFITHNTVNKLLIQNKLDVKEVGKETLVLKEMENRLRENPMVRDAEVFISINGVLGARIEQRDPIGRVASSNTGLSYYLDTDGKKMPLSEVYSARVPLITGVAESNYDEITPFLIKLREDDFMQRLVVGINRRSNGEIELELRKSDINVLFGKPQFIEKKFQNFKAFYKKTKQDSTLYEYEKVNLKFNNQVIATKKEDHGK
ncbi:cell division protein FtsQ/DivIB [Aequorivita viscosa]|uniref:Cell division protein FtsQ n=1 Tax=Aequorivita viscosa TaxID=797419 RepID=A0A1M6CU74_9FLAO|nr:cell division protein FtsQ/DivIB [Aequorivita viscosa]SDW40593.1 cell division protein FtsQ [Aequorivita viscosa]SHI64443.1 cell division protein FtsQ [Aequorivita viscosa]